MEVEEIQTRKFARIGNGEEDGKLSRRTGVNGDADGGGVRGWNPHHASRIIRVSRASGGKDRHSKVWTSKGPRDRRVRLSVGTAIQFYDLQDRLGVDQPSKAVEWLIKAASDSIAELPSLNTSFPETPKQLSDERKAIAIIDQAFDSVKADLDGGNGDADPNFQQNQSQHLSLSKSACSSTSDTSKNSGLSFSRSEVRVNRVKARERARERAAKEKEKEYQSRIPHSSFSELLGGIGNVGNNSTSPPKTAVTRHWSSNPMDYFETGGLLGPSLSRNNNSSIFSGQVQSQSLPHTMSISPFTENQHNQELQHFSFVPDHIIPVSSTTQGHGAADYDLNFSISSGLSSYRGTLQSNSPSFLPHLQRFDGSPFFIGTSLADSHHHHHQFPGGFDPRLQLCYGDGSRNLDQKGKGKN